MAMQRARIGGWQENFADVLYKKSKKSESNYFLLNYFRNQVHIEVRFTNPQMIDTQKQLK